MILVYTWMLLKFFLHYNFIYLFLVCILSIIYCVYRGVYTTKQNRKENLYNPQYITKKVQITKSGLVFKIADIETVILHSLKFISTIEFYIYNY